MHRILSFLRQEAQKLKSMTRKQQIIYIWDYYKIPICALILAMAILTYTVGYQSSRKKSDVYAVLVNASAGNEAFFHRALEKEGLENGITVDTSLNYTNADEMIEEDVSAIQVLFAHFTMGDMDLFAAEPGIFDRYAAQDGFEDLSLLLTPQMQQENADKLVRRAAEDGSNKIVGIVLETDSPLHTSGYYAGPVVVGVVSQCDHSEAALAVIEYNLENTP